MCFICVGLFTAGSVVLFVVKLVIGPGDTMNTVEAWVVGMTQIIPLIFMSVTIV